MDHQSPKEPGMASPATYQITVNGKLAEGWTEWFNGSIIRVEHNSEGNLHTILTCHVKDQAHLLGILNQLNCLNLPLLQITIIRDKGEEHAPIEEIQDG